MWSERMDSSSIFPKELPFRDERQFGFWKSEGINNFYAPKSDLASSPYITSPYGLRGHSLMSNGFDLNRDQRANALLGTYTPTLEKPSNFDLLRGFRQNLGSASYFTEEDQVKMSRALYENAPFSSSLPDSFPSGLRHSTNSISSFISVGADDPYEEKEYFESLKELEAKTIGNLLPDDDDNLFYGVADAIDLKNRPTSRDEIVDGFFIRVGEAEIGEDGQKKPEAFEGNHSLCEYPSRTLFLRNVNRSIQDSELRALFGHYGDISSLNTTCKRRGFVMVSFYDIRAACNAMTALQDTSMQHSKLDIHFSIPKENPSEKEVNQGILAVFNLDSSVSNDKLRHIFGVYGEVKEIRETPHRSHHKFIEFYDVRAADAAVRALNRTDIAGKKIKVEPIPLGGITSNSDAGTVLSARSTGRPPMSPYRENLFHNSPSVVNLESVNNQSDFMERSNHHGQSKFETRGTPNFHSHTRPDYHDGFANGNISNSPGNGICLSPGQQQMWSSLPRSQPQSMMWPNSPSFINGTSSPSPQQMHVIGRPPSHFTSEVIQMNNNSVGSAPSAHPSLWERRHGYSPESPDTSAFNSGSPRGLSIPNNFPHIMELIPHNVFPSKEQNVQLHPQNQQFLMVPTRGRLSPLLRPLLSPFTSPTERTRGRRNDGSLNQGDKKQFELDIDRIMKGGDKRTTLMIKNIPNKYTSKMLLAALDEHHKGTYDFLYLPIDFKNKCNVGYSFINMTAPSLIVPLYQALNGKKWEKFNSEKVASLAYARIQGKAALVAHFQNSSLWNEDKRCRPILFHSDGPNVGNQVPFPVGENNRLRARTTSSSSLENIQEGLRVSATEEKILADSKSNFC